MLASLFFQPPLQMQALGERGRNHNLRRMKSRRTYQKYLRSSQWKQKRRQAFELFGKKCKKCGATNRLEINHKHYRNIYNEDITNDLEVLCAPCHRRHHGIVFVSNGKHRNSIRRTRLKRLPPALTMQQYRAQGKSHRSTMLQ